MADQVDKMKPAVRSITLTPSWSGILGMLIAALEDGTPEGKQIAREELARMADLADRYVDLSK